MRRNRAPISRYPGTSIPDGLSLIRSFNIETNPSRPVRPSPLTASTIPDMPLDLVDRIRSFPLFLSAPENFLTAIGKHLRPQVNPPYDHILTEGDEAKAMYWLVRGAVTVTSRDGEATYAELRPGAFFGEIGILMEVPRTATIIARTKCLLLVLRKEDLRAELPNFPGMEKTILDEAQERLNILNKKRMESGYEPKLISTLSYREEKSREAVPGEISTGEVGVIEKGLVINTKKRKSPTLQSIEDLAAGSSFVNVRKTLKELPLFSNLSNEILHILGLSAQPKTYAPFTDIIIQGSPGHEVYFIVRGEAEVIHSKSNGFDSRSSYNRPRIKQGQYFGEVASLDLASERTATVRAITTVECLMISGEALEEMLKKCCPEIRRQVELTAMTRIARTDENIFMTKISESSDKALCSIESNCYENSPPKPASAPRKSPSCRKLDPIDKKETIEPLDPDPFRSFDIDNIKTSSRRGSWDPPEPENNEAEKIFMSRLILKSSISSGPTHYITSTDSKYRPKRPKTGRRLEIRGPLPDGILIMIFSFLDIYQLMRLRQISTHWSNIATSSPLLCQTLDLSLYNRHVTNAILINFILPFVGTRVREVDISNCYHLTDEGFAALSAYCGPSVKTWRMKSVWDISANAILEMANFSKNLEEVDLSNCRKVSDYLLARIVGWVVTEPVPTTPHQSKYTKSNFINRQGFIPQSPPIGTVFGCPKLKSLTLSYCKHVTDRSMAHLAAHAHNRLESIDLTRCTTITDSGFQHWSMYPFENLRKLVLADCTYLTDTSIVYLCNCARGLRELDLSFCCALSDTATEVLSLGFPCLSILKLSFCGSAVSDSSLQSIGLHLLELKQLSVRGCVRVTGDGVEAVVKGCSMLELFDVSQCKNLLPWLCAGGEEIAKRRWRSRSGGKPRFETKKGGGAIDGTALSLR